MGPHTRTPETALAEARRQVPGWEIWAIDQVRPIGRTWSARPVGATTAVTGCIGVPDLETLVRAVREYERHLDEHISTTRKELDETPESWTGRVEMLTARLSALEGLAKAKG